MVTPATAQTMTESTVDSITVVTRYENSVLRAIARTHIANFRRSFFALAPCETAFSNSLMHQYNPDRIESEPATNATVPGSPLDWYIAVMEL